MTKFNYVIGVLDNQYLREVKDIILRPPATNKYEKLKTELIKRVSASNEKKIKQLLMFEELGDRTPSQFLRHLQSLTEFNVPDEMLKTIWTSRLPHGIQTILAGQPASSTLENLADLADRVNDFTISSPNIAVPSKLASTSEVSELTREAAELRKQLQNLSRDRNTRSRSQTTGAKRNVSRQRSQSNYRKHTTCLYHHKFGEKAMKCVKPSDYPHVRKLQEQSVMAVNDCPSTTGRLFITDRYSKTQFLVDTGSDLCVFPRTLIRERRARTDYVLCAANGSKIITYGYCYV